MEKSLKPLTNNYCHFHHDDVLQRKLLGEVVAEVEDNILVVVEDSHIVAADMDNYLVDTKGIVLVKT